MRPSFVFAGEILQAEAAIVQHGKQLFQLS